MGFIFGGVGNGWHEQTVGFLSTVWQNRRECVLEKSGTAVPELPEVETTCRAMKRYAKSSAITRVVVRDTRLRYPIPADLPSLLSGQRIHEVRRRGKYLLFSCGAGELLIHLGMSGSLRVVSESILPEKHDHVDLILENGWCIRYRDPRRFGLMLWTPCAAEHVLLRDLGPEPLESEFSGAYLAARARGRKTAVKSFIMDSHVVVGVGNIYANEALFLAGIRPSSAAGRLAKGRIEQLAAAIKTVLRDAVRAGGTTLRDFSSGKGEPGYFQQKLRVYGRDAQPCGACESLIKLRRLGQRSTYYCPICQRP